MAGEHSCTWDFAPVAQTLQRPFLTNRDRVFDHQIAAYQQQQFKIDCKFQWPIPELSSHTLFKERVERSAVAIERAVLVAQLCS